MIQKKKLLEEVEEQCAKLKAEHEAWLEQKSLVLAAEEKRRTEAIAAEKHRILNLRSLDHQTRKRRLERLDAMEKYAHQTLDETAKMFQTEYERLESTLAMQRERADFEIVSRRQEEELQRVEFEAEKRVMDIHKQKEMEERLQRLRTEFVTRVKQQELQDLLKFESWKREDDDRKREVKMKLQRQEELAVLHQEKTVRQKLETQLLDQLVEKEKELLALETERNSRRQEQRAFDALDHEIDMRKTELEAIREHEREHESDVDERVDSDDEGGGFAGGVHRAFASHTTTDETQPRKGPVGRRKLFGERMDAGSLSEQAQNRWNAPAEATKRASSLRRQPEAPTAAGASDRSRRTSQAEELARLNRSLLHSASSESSFTSAVLERTMEEMTLLEKALRNISSSSSDNSSVSSNSQIRHTPSQHDQRSPIGAPRGSLNPESTQHFRFEEEHTPHATNNNNGISPTASTQMQGTTYQSPAHVERAEPTFLSRPGTSGHGEDDDEDGTEGSNTSNVVQRPIAELERELGIRFDDFSEEEKEGDSDDDSVDESADDDDAIEDDRARLLSRAKKLLEEEDFSSDDE